MKRLVSKITYALLNGLSRLPFALLYFISDGLYYITYYMVGYRKKTVYKNLKSFFPDKTEQELITIQKQFYRHFMDIMIEVVKSFTISIDELHKHLDITNPELLNNLYKQNKSVIIMSSHYGNWEWLFGAVSKLEHHSYATYSRIENQLLSDKIILNRERFGLNLILKQDTVRTIINNYRHNRCSVYALLSDQSPLVLKAFHWSYFLGQHVPVITGPEQLAKKYDFAVVYLSMNKTKRGFYKCSFELITDEPDTYQDYDITNLFLKKVEAQIRQEPAYYLWTHDRLKHVGKEHLSPKKPN